MKKALSEMTLEELWELFPIILSEPQTCWAHWYEEEKQLLESLLHDNFLTINHIGSTAIHRIMAKPIIDILIEIPESCSMTEIKKLLIHNGYLCMSESERRISFNKGYTDQGFAEKVFHLHLRYEGDNDELYFRDYMNCHPDLAKEYEKLKLSLRNKYEHDRDAYTNAKTAFVSEYTKRARIALSGRPY